MMASLCSLLCVWVLRVAELPKKAAGLLWELTAVQYPGKLQKKSAWPSDQSCWTLCFAKDNNWCDQITGSGRLWEKNWLLPVSPANNCLANVSRAVKLHRAGNAVGRSCYQGRRAYKAICCLEQFPRPAIFALRFRNLFEQAAVSHNELEMFWRLIHTILLWLPIGKNPWRNLHMGNLVLL